MGAEGNVGIRLLLIGKDGALAGIRELTTATAALNAEIARGAAASKTAAAGYDEQMAGLAALGARMEIYRGQVAAANAETDALARVGKVAFFTLATAGAAWTYESIRWATSYQSALVQLRTQAGLTVSAMDQIGAAAMRNAAALGISPTAYVQAAYHPASTGFGVPETLAITSYGAKLAAIGNSNVEDTVNALTGVVKSYGFGSGQVGHTAALLNAIVGAGNMHWSDLNAALASGIAATSKTFGVSLPSVGGALARLTDLGTPAAQAGTRLRMALALLGAPSAQADKFLTDAGLSQTEAKDRSNAMAQLLSASGLTTTQLSSALRDNSGAGGIYNALELLHRTLAGSGMSPEMQAAFLSRAFGGGRMGTSIMQLYGNLPALAAKSGQIDRGATNQRFMSDWAETTQTLTFRLHELGAELETIGTQFGRDVLPWVSKGVGGFTDLLKVLDQNKGVVIALGGVITAVLVPAIGLYLYRALLSSGGAIRSVVSAYGRLILGQSAEDAALERTNAILAQQALATGRVATEDDLLGVSSGRVGGLAGMGGGLGGKLLGAGAIAGGGLLAGQLLAGKGGFTINPKTGAIQQIRNLTGSMLAGGGIGAGIGSVIPGVGTLVGGGIGAVAGGLYAERHQISHDVSSAWDDIFGGGGSAPATGSIGKNRMHITAHVYIDGKEVKNTVIKYTRQQAART